MRKKTTTAPAQPLTETRPPVPLYGRTGWQLTAGGALYGTGRESMPGQLLTDVTNLLQGGISILEGQADELGEANYGALYLFRLALYAAAAAGDAFDGVAA